MENRWQKFGASASDLRMEISANYNYTYLPSAYVMRSVDGSPLCFLRKVRIGGYAGEIFYGIMHIRLLVITDNGAV